MPETTLTKVDSYDKLESLKTDWNRLLSESDNDNPFLRFEWVLAWWRAFGHAHRLYILVIKDNGCVIGIAPLKQTVRNGLFGAIKTISFLGTPNADYCDFIGADKYLIVEKTVEYYANHRREWNKIDLSQIPESTSTRKALLNSLDRHKFNYKCSVVETCLSFVGSGQSDFRKGHLFDRPRSLRRSMTQLNEMGGLHLKVLTEPDDIRKHLPLFIQYHYNRWKGTTTPSKFNDYDNIVFYRELVEQMAHGGRIQLMTLSAGDKTIAFSFNFVSDNVVYLYTLAHDCFLNSKSPGKILIYLQAEQLLSAGYREIDYMRGGESYKSRLTNTGRSNYQVQIFRDKTAYLLKGLYNRVKKVPPVRWLIKSQRIVKLKRDISDYYISYGPFKTVKYSIRKILSGITRYHKTVKYVLRLDDLPTISGTEKYEIWQISLDDLPAIVSFYGFMEDSPKHKEFENRLRTGERCMAVHDVNSIRAAVWINEDRVLSNLEVSPELLNPEMINDCLAVLTVILENENAEILYLEISEGSNLNSVLLTAGFRRAGVGRHFGMS